MKVEIDAYISDLRSNRMGDRSEKITISADYESAGILSSITFQVPITEAKNFYIGQRIKIMIIEKEEI